MMKDLKKFTLRNAEGNEIKLTNYGAKVMSIIVPDRNGKMGNITLGYDDAASYINGDPFFGATVGRYANRIANGRFKLDGKEYQLALNDGPNHLHGGIKGFESQLWDTEWNEDAEVIKMHYKSADMEENYPGELNVTVQYSWTDDNELIIDFEALSNKNTIINLTNHCYFNLRDGGQSNILDHTLKINSEAFCAIGKNTIPTGKIQKVDDSPFDFRAFKKIGADINQKDEQIILGRGYDHNFVLENNGACQLAAEIFHEQSGRKMEVYTDQPGIQLYSGNWLDGSQTGHNNTIYGYRSGFCLECQGFPNAPNEPSFPSQKLLAGELYQRRIIYKFLYE